ncbi:MAG: hypothetical protein ACRELX_00720 [Longimicrobiales bacterium]
MDAFTVAEELIPGIELSADQLAQLRAINHKYYSRLFALSRTPGTGPAPTGATTPHTPREPTAQEASELRATLVADLLALLTPEQRRSFGGA